VPAAASGEPLRVQADGEVPSGATLESWVGHSAAHALFNLAQSSGLHDSAEALEDAGPGRLWQLVVQLASRAAADTARQMRRPDDADRRAGLLHSLEKEAAPAPVKVSDPFEAVLLDPTAVGRVTRGFAGDRVDPRRHQDRTRRTVFVRGTRPVRALPLGPRFR